MPESFGALLKADTPKLPKSEHPPSGFLIPITNFYFLQGNLWVLMNIFLTLSLRAGVCFLRFEKSLSFSLFDVCTLPSHSFHSLQPAPSTCCIKSLPPKYHLFFVIPSFSSAAPGRKLFFLVASHKCLETTEYGQNKNSYQSCCLQFE